MGFLDGLKRKLIGDEVKPGLVQVFGAESVGKGMDRLFDMADAYYQFGTGMYPHERVSTWLSLLGGIVTPEILMYLMPTLDRRTAEEVAAYPMTNLWDYLEEYWALYTTPEPAASVRKAAAAAAAAARKVRKTGFPAVSLNGRYVKTG